MSDEQATADTEEAEAKVEGPLAELLDYLVDYARSDDVAARAP